MRKISFNKITMINDTYHAHFFVDGNGVAAEFLTVSADTNNLIFYVEGFHGEHPVHNEIDTKYFSIFESFKGRCKIKDPSLEKEVLSALMLFKFEEFYNDLKANGLIVDNNQLIEIMKNKLDEMIIGSII